MAEPPAGPPSLTYYTITREGTAFGPYTLAEIQSYAAAGQLFLTDQAWPNGAPPPTTVGALLHPASRGDVTGGVVPYKNPAALAAYYVGLASILPLLGIVTGLIAVVLGIKGLKVYHAEPWRRGRLHAIAGIVIGSGLALVWLALAAVFALPLLSHLRH